MKRAREGPLVTSGRRSKSIQLPQVCNVLRLNFLGLVEDYKQGNVVSHNIREKSKLREALITVVYIKVQKGDFSLVELATEFVPVVGVFSLVCILKIRGVMGLLKIIYM